MLKIAFMIIGLIFYNPLFGQNQKIDFKNLKIKSLGGKSYEIKNLISQQNTVWIFFNPSCPLCKSYSLTLRELQEKYQTQNIKFIGVFFPKLADIEAIRKFVDTYQINFEILLDKRFQLAQSFQAKITPEVFVLNQSSELIYSGKIDNWAYSLGKKRAQATEFYLQDAIESILQNRIPPITKTEAVGCFIEIRK